MEVFPKYISSKIKRLDASKESLVSEGYLRKVFSPEKALFLYNYTNKTTQDNMWNQHTLNSRGHVYEAKSGKIVARPFPKFFNYQEHNQKGRERILSSKKLQVFEKIDGSLGIVYYYAGEWRVSTRGSFTSPQAKKATQMLSRYSLEKLPRTLTLLVEIVYPSNRILVNYGSREELVLIGAIQTSSGKEEDLTWVSERSGFALPSKFEYNSIGEVLSARSEISSNQEGFVIKLEDGYRVKIKGDRYLSVLKFSQRLNRRGIHRGMVNGKFPPEKIEVIPEEFYPEMMREIRALEKTYSEIRARIERQYHRLREQMRAIPNGQGTPQELSRLLRETSIDKKEWGPFFLLLKGLSIDRWIMRQIKV